MTSFFGLRERGLDNRHGRFRPENINIFIIHSITSKLT